MEECDGGSLCLFGHSEIDAGRWRRRLMNRVEEQDGGEEIRLLNLRWWKSDSPLLEEEKKTSPEFG